MRIGKEKEIVMTEDGTETVEERGIEVVGMLYIACLFILHLLPDL